MEASIDINEYFESPRNFRLDNERWIEHANLALLAERAPFSRLLLYECGMSQQDATEFMKKHSPQWALVEGAIPQVKYDLEQTNQLLAAMDKDVRKEYLRFTYQWVGPRSILRPEVMKRLKISVEQQENLKAIYYEFFERLHVANRTDSGRGMSHEEEEDYQAVSHQIEKVRDREMLAVLSSEQRLEWLILLGEPSEVLAPMQRGEEPSSVIFEKTVSP